MTGEIANLLFTLEAALPFVVIATADKTCSSSGSAFRIATVLKAYDWDNERWRWLECAAAIEKYRPLP